jgi:hypothetical protein
MLDDPARLPPTSTNLHDHVRVLLRGRRKRGVTVDKLRGAKKMAFVTVAALAIVLAVNAPSQARGMGGHEGGHSGGAVGHGFEGHHGFEGQHGFEGHRFDGHFDRGERGGFGFVSPYYPYSSYPSYGYSAPAYTYDAPMYYWYCPSYGAYYPSVASCPDTWVPVPAS